MTPGGVGLARLQAAGEPLAYAALRIGFGLTLMTHGLPKLLGRPHGSMADPMAGSIRLIDSVLGLPFALQIGVGNALLEGVGGPLLALGLGTRPLALAFALQMVGICLVLGPELSVDRPRHRISDHPRAGRPGHRAARRRPLRARPPVRPRRLTIISTRRKPMPFVNFKVPEAALTPRAEGGDRPPHHRHAGRIFHRGSAPAYDGADRGGQGRRLCARRYGVRHPGRVPRRRVMPRHAV